MKGWLKKVIFVWERGSVLQLRHRTKMCSDFELGYDKPSYDAASSKTLKLAGMDCSVSTLTENGFASLSLEVVCQTLLTVAAVKLR